ncbi:homocysteine S-methyltransferase 1 [Cucumis melo var. makuwa]|uniref:Homocysteine S-methyltransferase 1 n=1 Tax=Cucumis melo var. makuwa TaxID=1194695 RepID=A0A5A7SZC2_CUCMM|nr:homocysteine S-methyltransferase 1 [Cucumis melo var. makuwa]
MGIEKATTLLDDLLHNAGGCAVIDGGLATQLEKHGAVFNDPLWSAVCLINDPDLIKKVHLEYLEAGADILVTSSYQATIPGFISKGLSVEEGELLLEKSVKLAIEARDSFWDSVKCIPGHNYNRALVAASIGSYGAYLADGSEYSGHYGPDVNVDKLKDFHRRRLRILVDASPDLLAFETIPNKLEAQVCFMPILYHSQLWFNYRPTLTLANAPSGESFEKCLYAINKSDKVNAVGINCTPPHFIEALITKFKELTNKHIVVYPNSGEVWDGRFKKWLCSGFGSHQIVLVMTNSNHLLQDGANWEQHSLEAVVVQHRLPSELYQRF